MCVCSSSVILCLCALFDQADQGIAFAPDLAGLETADLRQPAGIMRHTPAQLDDYLVFQQWPDHLDRKKQRHEVQQQQNTAADSSQAASDSCWAMEASLRPQLRPPAPLWVHFAGGAMAGLVQSIVLDAWELGHYWLHHQPKDLIGKNNRHPSPTNSLSSFMDRLLML